MELLRRLATEREKLPPDTPKSFLEALDASIELIGELLSEVEVLTFDRVTGLLVSSKRDGYLAAMIGHCMVKPAAVKLMEGAKREELSPEETRDLNDWPMVVFKDVSYLALANAIAYWLGNKLLKTLADVNLSRISYDMVEIPFKDGIREVPKNYVVRNGGDEFAIITMNTHPNDVLDMVEGAAQEFRGNEEFFQLMGLPAGVDYGWCHFVEACEMYFLYCQVASPPKNEDAKLTLLKLIMIRTASDRCRREKLRSRVCLLAQLLIKDEGKFRAQYATIAKGADSVPVQELRRMIAEVEDKFLCVVKAARDGNLEVLLANDDFMLEVEKFVEHVFERDTIELESALAEVAGFNGDDFRLGILTKMAARGKLDGFLDRAFEAYEVGLETIEAMKAPN